MYIYIYIYLRFKVKVFQFLVCRNSYRKDKSPVKLRLSVSNFPGMRSRHASIHKIKESTKQSIIDHIESYYSSVSYY